jgi:hypothetical protein
MDRFYESFADLADPRAANAQHELMELLFIALLASLCGAAGCADMAEFGQAKEPLLRQVLSLAHGIPSHDTFSRVFRLLDPVAFGAAFRRFTAAFAQGAKIKKPKGVVAIDGKVLRRAYERGRRSMPCGTRDCQGFCARLGMMGAKDPNPAETPRASYTGRHSRPAAGWRRREDRL